MVIDAQALIAEFVEQVIANGGALEMSDMEHEYQPAPHQPHKLRTGKCAVYVFSLPDTSNPAPPAGRNCPLKVGMAGPKSNARFQSHHYDPRRANSTLAGSILQAPWQWQQIGAPLLSETTIGAWLIQRTDRDNFYLAAQHTDLLRELETFLKRRLRPMFEG